jgi:hypothetical protein
MATTTKKPKTARQVKKIGGRRWQTLYDTNHHEIVKAIEMAGISVIDTARKSKGHPDIICLFEGVTCYVEIKYKDAVLTPFQEKWIVKNGKTIGKDYFVIRDFDGVNQFVEAITNAARKRQNQPFARDERTPGHLARERTIQTW